MKEVLVLFSGGKDSFLSTLIALEKECKVHTVTFQNGLELKLKNVLIGAKRIQKKYGKDRINIIGIKNIEAIWRELICEFYNWDIQSILNRFGKMTISQYNCLSCRLAMYIASIIICKTNHIECVIDGARKSQLFAIEQPKMIQKFKQLFQENNLNIEYPLLYKDNDFQIKNEILARGFIPKMNEAQCLLGMPIAKDGVSQEILEGMINVYDKYLYAKTKQLINQYKNITFEGEYL